jgi:hypothetical protein
MSSDDLPLSTAAGIEQQIRARVEEGLTAPNVQEIASLTRQRAELSDTSLFDEARKLVSRIATAGYERS